MKVQFTVTVTLGRRDAQPIKEFKKEDGRVMIPYLKEKLEEAMRNSWQYNAVVDNVKVTRTKFPQTVKLAIGDTATVEQIGKAIWTGVEWRQEIHDDIIRIGDKMKFNEGSDTVVCVACTPNSVKSSRGSWYDREGTIKIK